MDQQVASHRPPGSGLRGHLLEHLPDPAKRRDHRPTYGPALLRQSRENVSYMSKVPQSAMRGESVLTGRCAWRQIRTEAQIKPTRPWTHPPGLSRQPVQHRGQDVSPNRAHHEPLLPDRAAPCPAVEGQHVVAARQACCAVEEVPSSAQSSYPPIRTSVGRGESSRGEPVAGQRGACSGDLRPRWVCSSRATPRRNASVWRVFESTRRGSEAPHQDRARRAAGSWRRAVPGSRALWRPRHGPRFQHPPSAVHCSYQPRPDSSRSTSRAVAMRPRCPRRHTRRNRRTRRELPVEQVVVDDQCHVRPGRSALLNATTIVTIAPSGAGPTGDRPADLAHAVALGDEGRTGGRDGDDQTPDEIHEVRLVRETRQATRERPVRGRRRNLPKHLPRRRWGRSRRDSNPAEGGADPAATATRQIADGQYVVGHAICPPPNWRYPSKAVLRDGPSTGNRPPLNPHTSIPSSTP